MVVTPDPPEVYAKRAFVAGFAVTKVFDDEEVARFEAKVVLADEGGPSSATALSSVDGPGAGRRKFGLT